MVRGGGKDRTARLCTFDRQLVARTPGGATFEHVRLTEEFRDIAGNRCFVDFGWRSDLQHLALSHDRDTR
ncbi:hypothetical protein D3C87_2047530 [compost metagenome]